VTVFVDADFNGESRQFPAKTDHAQLDPTFSEERLRQPGPDSNRGCRPRCARAIGNLRTPDLVDESSIRSEAPETADDEFGRCDRD
jgi:hypothetical protein